MLSFSGARHAQESKLFKGGSSRVRGGGTAVTNQRIGENRSSGCCLRGRGFLWASEGSHSTPSFILSSTSLHKGMPFPICHCLPSAPSGVYRTQSLQTCNRDCRTGIRSCLPSCLASFRGSSACPHATLCIQLGGIKWIYRCQVERCKEGPSTSCATICTHVCKVHLAVGLVCPSCGKSFFNLDTFQCHKKGHVNL